jgi:hypothetical protein
VTRGLIWAGTDDGKVWLTRNEGKEWTDLTANFPKESKGLDQPHRSVARR